jgi:hypothetical protein
MKLINSYTQIKQIDNTMTGTIMDGSECKGYYSSRLMTPNAGKVINSNKFNVDDVILYTSSTDYIYKGTLLISDCAVFLVNDILIADGVIVEKQTYEQKTDSNFSLRTMDFFIVTQSNINSVKIGDVVTIKARACTRFNIDTKEFFFIPKSSIVLVINVENGIVAGPTFQKIKVMSIKEFGIVIDDELKGMQNDRMFYFNDAEYRVTIDSVDYHIVRNDCVYRID